MSRLLLSIAIMLLLAPVAVASHDPPTDGSGQEWTLNNDGTMTRTDHPVVLGHATAIASGGSAFWCADEDAIVPYDIRGVVFNWKVQFLQATTVQYSMGKCVGEETRTYQHCYSDGPITMHVSLRPLAATHELEHERAATLNRALVAPEDAGPGCLVQENESLGFAINATNGDAKVGHHALAAAALRPAVEPSTVTSDKTPPGYPTPELGTILLVVAGLGVVAMVVRRRKA